MPEVIDAFGVQFHGWVLTLIIVGPLVVLILGLLLLYGRLESLEHVEALERAHRLNANNGHDNGSSGDDNYAGVGDVVRAETKP